MHFSYKKLGRNIDALFSYETDANDKSQLHVSCHLPVNADVQGSSTVIISGT